MRVDSFTAPSESGVVFWKQLVVYVHPDGGHIKIRMCAGCWFLRTLTKNNDVICSVHGR